MARICLILQVLEKRELLEHFLTAGILDSSIPLPQARLEQILGENRTPEDVELFLAEQYRACPRNWEEGEHLTLEKREPLPFYHYRSLGHGGQGSVDEIKSALDQRIFARKVWSNINRQAEQRFFDERVLLKRLDPAYHIIQITGTYTRGRELGLIHLPVAQCDLWEALSLPEVERRSILPDHALRQALGCLSVGLAHMHQHGIRHKDVKPHNILINEQRFVYTDFGLSKDISELSNSITGGGQGTAKYRAPELARYDMEAHQAPADVFALGCVLMEVYSVLRGWTVDDEHSFSHLAPFHEHLEAVYGWIDTRIDFDEQNSTWLELCSRMLQKDPNNRPRMKDVITTLIAEIPEPYCCEGCLRLLYGSLDGELEHEPQLATAFEGEADVGDTLENPSGPNEELETNMLTSTSDLEQLSLGLALQMALQSDFETARLPLLQPGPQACTPPASGETIDTTRNHFDATESPALIYQDCFSRRFRFPYNLCKYWRNMEPLIRESLPATADDQLRHAIEFGNYDLMAPNGPIHKHLWEQTVQPGWTIKLSLWPSTANENELLRQNEDRSQLLPNFRNPRQPQTQQSQERLPQPDNRSPAQEPAEQTATTPRLRSPAVAVVPQRRRSPSPRRRRTNQPVSPLTHWISASMRSGGNRRRPAG
ncbi:kinase-like protein [Cenococcum geophilum]